MTHTPGTMSNDKSIFEPKEGFASEPPSRSPFAVDEPVDSPFASTPEGKSPFSMDDDESATRLSPGGSKSPEKPADPFASGQDKSPFGYEPPVAGFGGSPFEGSPSPSAPKDSPFAGEVGKDEPASAPVSEDKPAPAPSPEASEAEKPASPSPVAAPPVAAPAAAVDSSGESDSSAIRQLELRAIFGVDRELTEAEMLQRSRALPGIRHLARIGNDDVGAIDGVKRILGNLDFGGGQVQLYCNNAPVEFIREGSVMLAVQNEGGYAPGVRETLMIVARELGRM